MSTAYILDACRTPGGKALRGVFRHTRPDDLAAAAIRALLERTATDPLLVEDVILGCAFPEAEQGMNVARIAALKAGLPVTVPAQTVNRFCASGLQAIATAAERILAGGADCIIAGGTDLLGEMRDGILPDAGYPEILVNIKDIPGLDRIREEGDRLVVGALTRLEDLAADETVKSGYAALAEAARKTASPHIREMGTVAGNICQNNRCWYYWVPGNVFYCLRKGGKACYALTGDARYHSIFGAARVGATACTRACPNKIDMPEYLSKIREGDLAAAADILLKTNPLPAITGRVCPHWCESDCARGEFDEPVSIREVERFLGDQVLDDPEGFYDPPKRSTGKRVAVIGGGPAGLSVAWQLRQRGHEAVVYDVQGGLGGKISTLIPKTRIPDEVVSAELGRIREAIPHVHLQQRLSRGELEQLKVDFDLIVIAVGAQKPRIIPIPGKEKLVPALEFLRLSKQEKAQVGKRVVIIGAGNVGCDAATEAHRLGAEDITLIDIQEPLSFGKEREEAERVGAKFLWPRFSKAVTDEGLELTTGEVLPADTVIISIGDMPDLDFLPETIETERGYIKVDDVFRTSDPQVYAVGDAVKLGLLTDAIGMGRKTAQEMADVLEGKVTPKDLRKRFDYARVKVEYFDPRLLQFEDVQHCASQCSSCGACRDCGICATICPQAAITRVSKGEPEFEMVVNPDRCIGCGFCVGACPCGIWTLVENDPIG